jgi:hypothetical protein
VSESIDFLPGIDRSAIHAITDSILLLQHPEDGNASGRRADGIEMLFELSVEEGIPLEKNCLILILT